MIDCSYCAVGPRLPGMIVCGSCFLLKNNNLIESLKDPNVTPICDICKRQEPTGRLFVFEGADVWTCADCIEDADEPEAWKGDGDGNQAD